MAYPWKDYQLELAPPWLRKPRGEAWLRAAGDVKDSLELRAKESVKARFPLLAPPGALAALGSERQMDRGPGESATAYAARLRGAWETWPWAGTPFGLLNALWDAGYTNVKLEVMRGVEYGLDANRALTRRILPAGSWRFDAGPQTFWSKFLVAFVDPLPAAWIPNAPASNSDEANAIRALVKKWKPGHATCAEIIIQQSSSETWDYYPDGDTWDSPAGTWPAIALPWIHWTP